jgi:hypothetical protein
LRPRLTTGLAWTTNRRRSFSTSIATVPQRNGRLHRPAVLGHPAISRRCTGAPPARARLRSFAERLQPVCPRDASRGRSRSRAQGR